MQQLTHLAQSLEAHQSLPLTLATAFVVGILVSFTPCIYPMIPITVSILQAQASASVWHNFFRALAYVLGIATVYSVLGYVVATTTLIFGQWLASPWFIAGAVAFFAYFAGAMFGYYDLYIPRFLTRGQHTTTTGSLISNYLFAIASGTVASPCLTPALALMLGYVARVGNPVIGFTTLFSFSMGMGILLIGVGTFSGALALLPRAGDWMIEIKKLFGLILLGVCIYILSPLLASYIEFMLYSVISAAGAVYAGLTRCQTNEGF